MGDSADWGAGEDSDDAPVNGGDGSYHTSKLRGAAGCWIEELTVPSPSGEGCTAITVPPLAEFHSPMKGARRQPHVTSGE